MSSYYFGSSKAAPSNDNKNIGKTKISVSILGDAFVDLFCYLNDGSSTNGGSLPQLGADVRVNQPVKPMAGGSGINTATHLASLIQDFPYSPNNGEQVQNEDENVDEEENDNEEGNGEETDKEADEEPMDVTLQTVVNENDDYGRLLIEHSKRNNFQIINCRREKDTSKGTGTTVTTKDATTTSVASDTATPATSTNTTTSTTSPTTDQENTENDQSQTVEESTAPSTGHCIVLVTENERSFITHLGIMESFQPSHTILHELIQCRSANPTFTNHHHHVHIAGYYNVPKFHSKNALKKRINLIREKRRTKSHGLNVYTTTISLTPQYDATEKWDTDELFNLLPMVDFLILNLMEACKISKIDLSKDEEENGGSALNRSVLFLKLADFYDGHSPQTYVVVTLGKFGAVLLYGGEIAYTHNSPMKIDTPVDATGAGDAFVSGFLFGTMNWRRKRQHDQVHEIGSVLEKAGGWTEAIEVGMEWGCITGTACVMNAGASVPASKDEIELLMYTEDTEDEDNIYHIDGAKSNDEEGQVGGEEEGSDSDSDYRSDDESSSDYSSSYADEDYYMSDDEEVDDIKDKRRWI
jgi:sugar/nucleoside kinase (ribokinase family)